MSTGPHTETQSTGDKQRIKRVKRFRELRVWWDGDCINIHEVDFGF